MKKLFTAIVAFCSGGAIFFLALGFLLSDTFIGAGWQLVLVLLLMVGAYFLLAVVLGYYQPQSPYLMGVVLAMPSVLISAILFVGVAGESGILVSSVWIGVGAALLLVAVGGTLLGARLRIRA